MDSFELNKIIGAILGTLLFVMGVGFVAEAIYSPIQDRGPGLSLPEPDLVASAEEAEPEAPAVPAGRATRVAAVTASDAAAAAARRRNPVVRRRDGDMEHLWLGDGSAAGDGAVTDDTIATATVPVNNCIQSRLHTFWR